MDRLSGVIPILMMPFDAKGMIDYESLRNEVDFLVEAGAETLGFGFASEGFRLSHTEQADVVKAVVDQASGRARVMVHVMCSSTLAAVEQARQAIAWGADLMMVPAPSFVPACAEDQFGYFAALAADAGLPMVVQDAPAMTGTSMSAALLVRLLTELDTVVAVKIEHLPSVPKIAEVTALLPGATGILGGAAGLEFYSELVRGATGTMPGPALPEFFRDVLRQFQAGDHAGARRLFNRYLPLIVLGGRSLDTFLWTQKEMLLRRGVFSSANMRAPAERFEARLHEDLDALASDLLPYESQLRDRS